jgi:hypothetical protein
MRMVGREPVNLSLWNGRKEFYSPAPSHGEDFLPLDLAIIGGRLFPELERAPTVIWAEPRAIPIG